MNQGSVINIAKDFSRFPAGRYLADGKFPGEKFREMLVGALSKNESVTVVLDGVLGFGSSFLEEAFGGLVRHCGFKASELTKRLKLVSVADATLIDEILSYIKDARPL